MCYRIGTDTHVANSFVRLRAASRKEVSHGSHAQRAAIDFLNDSIEEQT